MQVKQQGAGDSYEVGAQIVEMSYAEARALERYLETRRTANGEARKPRAHKSRRTRS